MPWEVLTGDKADEFLKSILPSKEEFEEISRRTKERYDRLTKDSKYQWDESWGELSGFKGMGKQHEGYEWCCRFMFLKGLEWLDENPGAKPKQHRPENVYGLSFNTNKDGEELEKHVEWACEQLGNDGPSGAQVQAVMSHLGYVAMKGFDEWKKEKIKKK